MRDNKHSFAIYFPDLNVNLGHAKKLLITSPELVHRIYKILRLQVGDNLELFSAHKSVVAQIGLLDKKQLVLENIVLRELAPFKPDITIALGVLKKENFENALYSCVELGASAILPIIFAKSTPLKLNQERVDKILIAASEQSKNFNLPKWHEPITFDQFLAQIKKSQTAKKVINSWGHPEPVEGFTCYIYCDINGKPMLPLISQISAQIKNQVCEKIVLIIGPEGDLTSQEQAQFLDHQVLSMQLTPTVLRSFQAVTVALGALRSLL